MKCNFDKAWIGLCNKKTVDGELYCKDHLEIKCVVCGEQATHACTWASSLSCGAPLCDKKKCIVQHGH